MNKPNSLQRESPFFCLDKTCRKIDQMGRPDKLCVKLIIWETLTYIAAFPIDHMGGSSRQTLRKIDHMGNTLYIDDIRVVPVSILLRVHISQHSSPSCGELVSLSPSASSPDRLSPSLFFCFNS